MDNGSKMKLHNVTNAYVMDAWGLNWKQEATLVMLKIMELITSFEGTEAKVEHS